MKNSLCFVGSTGQFSLVALQTLLAQQIHISQIILAGYAPATRAHKQLPVSPPILSIDTSTIPALASRHHIPIRYAGDDINNFTSWENFPHDAPPDFLFVACFPNRLPTALRQWPREWAINLHPSLLPAYRGPDPLFWQLQHGETQTGFSLHLLAEALDAGPILLQKSVHLPQGASRGELDTLLAQQGTEALCTLLSTPSLNPHEQDHRIASYHPSPQSEDYVLNTHWSAEHAFNFICGTHLPANGYPILIDDKRHYIASAVSFEPQQKLGKKCARHNHEILIQFSPGVLHAKPV